ncbi:hypothetical protein SteCoe_39601 [Stentor coeruleus]|uniref:MORN repeat-containing protein 5 n=1 Tax=Stentor coeruleus TaxID=5963 RepID=A0A1R2AKL6_9CILI|nr:hypothetical protein SteCoe_39601 [Stentor coeruleus]
MQSNRYSNWLDYETHVLEKSNYLIKITNDNSTFLGDDVNGKGIIISNYNKYKGQVKDTKINGYGCLLDENKIQYFGEYENGLRNGIGYYIYNNGYKYKGHWKADKRHGLGYLFTENSVIYGMWENDYLVYQMSAKVSFYSKASV